jgi:spore coat protein A, manganese oxidase
MKRRAFLKTTTTAAGAMAAAVGLPLFNHLREIVPALGRSSVNNTLRGSPLLAKFVDPLPLPNVLKPVEWIQGKPFYRLAMTQFQQQLHRDLPPTTVWGFQGSYPGPTIEARTDHPIVVQWINNLPTKHLLPIDHTICGAEPPVPDVRSITHLHGLHVSSESDGDPLKWFTPGQSRTDHFPNCQPATMLWYHDHALAITRLNVYAGLAGFYLLRDEIEDQLNLPCGPFEIPLMIQDRSFQSNGQLFYPNRGITEIHPVWVPEFIGDTTLVNGKVLPFLEVEPRRYRFRILNACNSCFLHAILSSGQPFYQIGGDGGFLSTPVKLTQLLLGAAERADVILDFSGMRGATVTMTHGKAPFPRSGSVKIPEILQFRVTKPLSTPDNSSIPSSIAGLPFFADSPVVRTRDLTLNEELDAQGRCTGVLLNGLPFSAPVTEKPKLGTTEIWRFINLAMGAHPIHLHLVQFHVLDRCPFDMATYQSTGQLVFTGSTVPRFANEAGLKDTVIVGPSEVLRIKVRFTDFTGCYVWHCHRLEHEDNDMMRPFEVVP